MNMQDIRWKHRFDNYVGALERLSSNAELCKEKQEEKSFNVLRAGLIRNFEITYNLSWKTMKDYLEYQGVTGLIAARDTIRMAFKLGLIDDGEAWMAMIDTCINKAPYAYEDKIAAEIYKEIIGDYHPAFMEMKNTLDEK